MSIWCHLRVKNVNSWAFKGENVHTMVFKGANVHIMAFIDENVHTDGIYGGKCP